MRLKNYKKTFYFILSIITFFYLYRFSKINEEIDNITKEFKSSDRYLVIENIIKEVSEDKFKVVIVEKIKPYCKSNKNPTVFKLPDYSSAYNSDEFLLQKGWDDNHDNYFVILTDSSWDNIGINLPQDCEVRVLSSTEKSTELFKRNWLLRSTILKKDIKVLEDHAISRNKKYELLLNSSNTKNYTLPAKRESPYSYLNNLSFNQKNFDSFYKINSKELLYSLPFNNRTKKLGFFPISFKVLNSYDMKNKSENIKSIYSLVGSNWFTKKECFSRNKNKFCKISFKKLYFENIFPKYNQDQSLVSQEIKLLQARVDGNQPLSILFLNH